MSFAVAFSRLEGSAVADFTFQVQNPVLQPTLVERRLTVVRFARAVTGFSDAAAPDLDDHGFTPAPAGGTALGPTVGVIKGRTIRVRLVRDRISDVGRLFATSDDDSIASIEYPAAGTALETADVPAAADGSAPGRKGDCIYIHGASTASTTAETKVKVRFGAADGPVLAELQVRVYPLLWIRVQAHAVAINGTAAATTIAQVRTLFERANRIYAQAGIQFAVQPTLQAEVVAGFARAGTVTLTAVNDARNVELQTVLNQRPAAGMLNAYFFPHYFDTVSGQRDETLGIAFSHRQQTANPPVPGFPGCHAGVTVNEASADMALRAHTVAHEIGHALTLEHYDNGNGTSGAATDMRQDLWAHRCLMHNMVDLWTNPAPATQHYKSSAARIDVGYGTYADGTVSAGELLMTRRRPRIFQSEQIRLVRAAVLARTFAP